MRMTGRVSVLLAACCLFAATAGTQARQESKDNKDPVAQRADIHCTGFVSELPPRTDLMLVGSEKENIKSYFSQGDVVYVNRGQESGVYPGALFLIVRPIGKFRHPFTGKVLGYHTREVGMVRVMEVRDRTSTAEITVSCEPIAFGDLLRPYEANAGPPVPDGHPLPRYGEGTGDVTGQIVMSRNYHEFHGTNSIVYIDLGHRHGVRPGDNFTIFRQINRHEGIAKFRDDKIGPSRSGGYGSDRFRGGDYSLEAANRPLHKVIEKRPLLPRKVLGELIVLKVENNVSVAMITRSVAEINVGDFIERAN